jgi:ribulose kinase
MSSEQYVIGIDVGTGSARAGIFDVNGKMLASASEPIEMWKPKPGYAEQSSADIWRAICKVVRPAAKKQCCGGGCGRYLL